MQPIEALDRISFLLERALAPTYKVQAFRKAEKTLESMAPGELERIANDKQLKSIPGIGDTTAKVISECIEGKVPEYLAKLEAEPQPTATIGAELRSLLKGDCHTHSLWSDGGSPIIDMARTARSLGHEYIVLTDHSPNLTVANGLTAERLIEQITEVATINEIFEKEAADGAPSFRILTGIETDILEDGSIDQAPELLEYLDVVVASVHSKLRMDEKAMTKRMIRAIENPLVDILGHCTGRKVMGRTRPQSTFDHKAIFEACVETGTAVEINSRPERQDPPRDLLRLAAEIGCTFSIDTDAHAPGQLDFQYIGCDRAAECGVEPKSVINTNSASELLALLKSKSQ